MQKRANTWTPERRAAASARSKALWADEEKRRQAGVKRSAVMKARWADPRFRLEKLLEIQRRGTRPSLEAKIAEARAQVEALDELI